MGRRTLSRSRPIGTSGDRDVGSSECAKKLERTDVAPRPRSAHRLRVGDQEGVELLVHGQIRRDVLGEVPLHLVVGVCVEQPNALADPDRVRVDDEGRMAACVEEDRIRCLRADPGLGEEVGAHYVRRAIEITR